VESHPRQASTHSMSDPGWNVPYNSQPPPGHHDVHQPLPPPLVKSEHGHGGQQEPSHGFEAASYVQPVSQPFRPPLLHQTSPLTTNGGPQGTRFTIAYKKSFFD
jgi:hypothetical protein